MGRNTMHVLLQDGSANALDLCKDCTQVVVGGRSVFKIYSIEEDRFEERANLRVGKNINLNYSCNDVVWSPIDDQQIATAATNGAVVVWNLNKSGKSKQEQVFGDHKRTVNKVNFHPSEAGLLLSGSQDGTMKLFDLRADQQQLTFPSNTESVRDVQFNPHCYWQFSAVSENGKVQLWDIRRSDRWTRQWPAHNNHVFACDWHPEIRNWLATAGRDRTIKVWDTNSSLGDKTHGLEHTIHTIGPVNRVKWRPHRRDYLGSSALVVDFAVNVWDVQRPYVPFAAFNLHKDVTTDIAWAGDPHTMLSTSKDGTLYQHVFSDALRPGDKANPVGMSISNRGEVTHAHRHASRNSQNHALPGTKMRGLSEVYRKSAPATDKFRLCTSRLLLHQPTRQPGHPRKELSVEEITRETASRYKLVHLSLAEACDHNATVARSLGQYQVALTWNVLKTLHASSRSDLTRPTSGDLGKVVAGEIEGERGRHPSHRRVRRVSGKKSLKMELSKNSIIGGCNRHMMGNSSESEEEEQQPVNCHDLTAIAGGQGSGYSLATITGDFFGEAELAGLGVEHLVSLEGGGGVGVCNGGQLQTNQDSWILPSEAFEQRHEIKDKGEEESMVVGEEGGEATMQTVTVEDKTSAVVVWGVHAQDCRVSWSPIKVTRDTLTWLAEQGDVQNAVSMYVVLAGGRNGCHGGQDRVKGLVEESVLEHWWLSYVDLLQRLMLFTQANEIVSLCTLPKVHTLNQESTTVYTACTRCGKPLSKGGGAWWCDRCKAPPARCAVCHSVVKGLFVWCQGCSHGGHIRCLGEWIKMKTTCPAGCGHYCEYH